MKPAPITATHFSSGKLFQKVTAPVSATSISSQFNNNKKRESLGDKNRPVLRDRNGTGSSSDSELVTSKTAANNIGNNSLRKKDGSIKTKPDFNSSPQLPWSSPSLNGISVGERGGHSATLVNSNGKQKLFVFGGGSFPKIFNDLIQLDLQSRHWSHPLVTGGPPPARYAHTATAYGNKIIVFGGFDGTHWFDDSWLLDTVSLNWTKISTSGYHPAPRYAHTATLTNDRLLLFGGCAKTEYFNDVWMLDIGNGSWSRMSTGGDVPAPRAYHSVVLSGTRLYMFGGRAGDHFFDDLYILDTTNMKWTKGETCALIPNVYTTPSRRGPRSSLDCPAARAYHTSVLWNTEMVVFGGFDGTNFYDDCWVLDTVSMQWRLVGIAPTTLCKHSASLVGNDLVILGGYDGKNYLDRLWVVDCLLFNTVPLSGRSSIDVDSEKERRVSLGSVDGITRTKEDIGKLIASVSLNGLSLSQLDDVERIHVDGLKRLTAARQDAIKKEIEQREQKQMDEIRRLKKELEEKEQSRLALSSQLDSSQAEVRSLQTDFRNAQTELKQKAAEFSNRITSLQDDVNSLRAENARLSRENAVFRQQAKRQSLGSEGSQKQTRFDKVEIREYKRALSGGGGVPDDSGPSVGLDWDWERESTQLLSPFERQRQATRVTREDYMTKGFLPAEERKRILAEAGHKNTSLEKDIREISEIKRQRQESIDSPSGILLLSQPT